MCVNIHMHTHRTVLRKEGFNLIFEGFWVFLKLLNDHISTSCGQASTLRSCNRAKRWISSLELFDGGRAELCIIQAPGYQPIALHCKAYTASSWGFWLFFRFISFLARKVRAEPAFLCSKPLPWASDKVSQWNLPSSPLLPSILLRLGKFWVGLSQPYPIPLQMHHHHHHQKKKKKKYISRLWSFVI